ncbi:MAG: hypothetical protein A3E01_09875 [Gammaproteobacteria bacterium RIFCSPHIGHO2_12_FULL_63_22]|nr:MAG: hypothetical protein A3E01_09875 [Gammaproteobacteria bacterium RIFCSPHIGHO2_12_FULL_63_22]
MKVLVLKSFSYAGDEIGVQSREAVTGTEIEMSEAFVPGLMKEGYVRVPPPLPAPRAVRVVEPDAVGEVAKDIAAPVDVASATPEPALAAASPGKPKRKNK